jgi:hypothetical protein
MQNALCMTQEATGELIFEPIATHETVKVEVNKKFISRLVNKRSNVHDAIRSALSNPVIIQITRDYFSNIIFSCLNSFSLNDVHAQLLNRLQDDPSVSLENIGHLDHFYVEGKFSYFLAECFLYACSRPNKEIAPPPPTEDFPLLAETTNECPLCHETLTKTVKGHITKKYGIVKIFPENLDEQTEKDFREVATPSKKLDTADNHIALCLDHAESYLLEPELEEYIQLSQLKQLLSQNYYAKQSLTKVNLEEEISDIINALSHLSNFGNSVPLSLKALIIKDKILSEYPLLRKIVQDNVLTYYHFINDLFEEMETYPLIASEIKKAFRLLDKSNLSQPEIIDHLSEWILHQSGLPSVSFEACKIIVSFFIQSCEVFNEISQ